MKQSRTHNCGELRLCDAGKQVTIVGWMENVVLSARNRPKHSVKMQNACTKIQDMMKYPLSPFRLVTILSSVSLPTDFFPGRTMLTSVCPCPRSV